MRSNRKLSLDELNRLSVEQFKEATKNQLIIVLDDIRSMNNVGSAFRTADSFACEEICLVGITAKPPHREISKTALGADEAVAWSYFPDIASCVSYLRNKGFSIYSIEQVEQPVYLQDFVPVSGEKYALVFGNEVFGVNDDFIEASKGCIEIPQFGTKHSLNVSVTMGIVIWDILSKLNYQY